MVLNSNLNSKFLDMKQNIVNQFSSMSTIMDKVTDNFKKIKENRERHTFIENINFF